MVREEERVNLLVEKIKGNVSKGYDLTALRWTYVNQGYSKIEVDKAIKMVQEEMNREKVLQEKSQEYILDEGPKPEPVQEKKSFWGNFKGLFSK